MKLENMDKVKDLRAEHIVLTRDLANLKQMQTTNNEPISIGGSFYSTNTNIISDCICVCIKHIKSYLEMVEKEIEKL